MKNERIWECTKQKCKWRGTGEEQAQVPNKNHPEFVTDNVCPVCGNDSFYELTERQIKNFLAKKETLNSVYKT